MKKIYSNLLELVGNTPLVAINKFSKKYSIETPILAKVEYLNPAGSAKDRVALKMIEDAEATGALKENGTIIEPTSGNTGVGLAFVATVKGYRVILTMPETMSEERRNLLRARGAELVLTPGKDGMKGAIEKAEELQRKIDGSIILQQFSNPSNPAAHAETTGEEIWRDTDGNVDILVAGVGTGGTLCGTAQILKKHNPKLKVFAVEPENNQVLSGKPAGVHKLQGIGANFIPKNYDASLVDEIIPVSDNDAIEATRNLVKTDGLLVGITSGAAAYAAIQIAKRTENKGKSIVVILPDSGERYLSTGIF